MNVTRNLSLVAGAGFSHFGLEVESGYDRFNRLETFGTEKAATVRLWRAHGGLEIELPIEKGHTVAFQVLAGRAWSPLTANEMTIDQDGRWTAIVGIAFRHPLK